MRESFKDYRKTLEPNLMKFSYLYSGEVLSSTDSSYSEIRSNNMSSPSFIINTINNIYEKSFNKMVGKSKEIVFIENNLKKYVIDEIFDLGINPLYFFIDINSMKKYIGYGKTPEDSVVFPHYFYDIKTIFKQNNKYKIYYSPMIIEEEGVSVIYAVDAAIQSLVYSIQNMECSITKEGNSYKHTMNYKLYDCKYDSYKIIIKDLSKIRDEKLNELLK